MRPARPRSRTAFASVLAIALTAAATAHAAAPDLTVTRLSDPPSEKRAGQTLRVREVVRNRGSARAPAAVVRYYLSADKVRGAGDVKLTGVRRVGRLRPRRGSGGSLLVRIPGDAKPGTYRLLACADPRRAVAEAQERNNCRASRRRVAVTGAGAGAPGGDPGSEPPANPGPAPAPLPAATLLAAGDIASCSETGDEQTAALLDALEGSVLTLGDNVYPDGTPQEFTDCYDPTWGRAKGRSRAAVGNHEYHTPGAAGHFAYFGAAAGDPATGYYSYDLGTWHVVVLNSNCTIVACAAGSPQEQWLRADLAAHPRACTLAAWHHARFNSGGAGNYAPVQPLWQALDDAGADVVLAGHAHHYERFLPVAPDGSADPGGIVSFVVGTGGKALQNLAPGPPPMTSAVRQNHTFGVLELRLGAGTYGWRFHPVAGGTFSDEGAQACH